MATPIEVNQSYAVSQDVCHGVLRDKVIPRLRLKYSVKYALGPRIAIGSIGLGVIEDDWRAFKLRLRMRYIGLVSYNMPLSFVMFARSTGPKTTMVEFVAASAAVTDYSLVNWFTSFGMSVPGYSLAVRALALDIYFDDTKVVDRKTITGKSVSNDYSALMLRVIFSRAHELLADELR